MRKFSPWVFLLPLVLLFAQQARVQHEIGHLASLGSAQAEHRQQQDPAEQGHCELCLSFAHIASAVGSEAMAPALLLDLTFHLGAVAPIAGVSGPAPRPRSRGPPVFS